MGSDTQPSSDAAALRPRQRWTRGHASRRGGVCEPLVIEPEPNADESQLARQLLSGETGADSSPTDVLDATNRVLARLHEPLIHWLGRDGTHAVLARALDRARGQHPVLAGARAEPTAVDQPLRLSSLAAPAADDEPTVRAERRAALVSVLAALFGILTRLIGGDLVLRLLRQVWPDGRFDLSPSPTIGLPVTPDTPTSNPTNNLANEPMPAGRSLPQTPRHEGRHDD